MVENDECERSVAAYAVSETDLMASYAVMTERIALIDVGLAAFKTQACTECGESPLDSDTLDGRYADRRGDAAERRLTNGVVREKSFTTAVGSMDGLRTESVKGADATKGTKLPITER